MSASRSSSKRPTNALQASTAPLVASDVKLTPFHHFETDPLAANKLGFPRNVSAEGGIRDQSGGCLQTRKTPGQERRNIRRRPHPISSVGEFTAAVPHELWMADITYLPTWEGWLFLAVVVDACSRRVCGWSMRDALKADLIVDALGMATTRRRPRPGVIHHSDRGGQYRSLTFGRTLRGSGILASMRSRGDAYDNAACESFMASIKTELVKRNTSKTRDEARRAVFSYIEGSYNPQAQALELSAVYLQSNTRRSSRRIVHSLSRSSRRQSTQMGQLQDQDHTGIGACVSSKAPLVGSYGAASGGSCEP